MGRICLSHNEWVLDEVYGDEEAAVADSSTQMTMYDGTDDDVVLVELGDGRSRGDTS